MLHVNFIPWALALLDFIRVSVDISGNGNDCLKIAWTEILENKDIQALFQSACEQTVEIRALIATDETFHRVVMSMLTSKIFHARANEIIRQYKEAHIPKQSISLRGEFKATSHNRSDPSQRQLSEEHPQSSINSQPKLSKQRSKSQKSCLEHIGFERNNASTAVNPTTSIGVEETEGESKGSLDSNDNKTKRLRTTRKRVRTTAAAAAATEATSTTAPSATATAATAAADEYEGSQHVVLPTNNMGPPNSIILRNGFIFHPAAAAVADGATTTAADEEKG